MTTKRYFDYPLFMKSFFNERVQKISVHAGLTCPNRDGTKGTGGCTFCNNESFSPKYCQSEKSITQQIEEGIEFFGKKHQAQKYIAYFQSYTNTYGDFNRIKEKYEEALKYPNMIGLAIGTRPDCISEEILDYLSELNKKYFILVEYGIESTNNDTLRSINRGHTYEDSIAAILGTHKKGILVAGHIIMGLPNENRDLILVHAKRIAKLPLSLLKLHQLQVIKGTQLAKQYAQDNSIIQLLSLDEYIDLCIDFMELLPPTMAIERFVSQTPAEFKIAPNWGVKNHEFTAKIDKRLKERDTFQGKLYIAE